MTPREAYREGQDERDEEDRAQSECTVRLGNDDNGIMVSHGTTGLWFAAWDDGDHASFAASDADRTRFLAFCRALVAP